MTTEKEESDPLPKIAKNFPHFLVVLLFFVLINGEKEKKKGGKRKGEEKQKWKLMGEGGMCWGSREMSGKEGRWSGRLGT